MAKRQPPSQNGFVIVDKPAGMSSHDVVNVLRKQLGERRIGHAGTLDPDATGVLLVGVGYVTRLLIFVSGLDKTYTGQIVLGSATTTLDSSGVVTDVKDMSNVTIDDVVRVVEQSFVGPISQIPPMVSALKVGGVRLHQLARQGIEIDRLPRNLTIHRFKVLAMSREGVIDIEVRCSAGTYIRSLADDIGRALGGFAHLRNLRRTAVGEFDLSQASPMDGVKVMSPIAALGQMSRVIVDDQTKARIKNGRTIEITSEWVGQSPWALVDQSDELLGVYEIGESGHAKPSVVLASAVL